eukprot:SAG31_NODE_43714_length_266_cov_0.598802_2_plen_70_part_01
MRFRCVVSIQSLRLQNLCVDCISSGAVSTQKSGLGLISCTAQGFGQALEPWLPYIGLSLLVMATNVLGTQ